jgi:hypothetical protein
MSKDILFSLWYDSLEGTKSQGFAYKAWCAGWEAAQKEVTLQEMSDIGQEIEPWDTSDMAHRPNGLSVEQAKLCKYCGGIGRVVCDGKCMPEKAGYDKLTVKFGERAKEYLVEAKKSWIGMSDVEIAIYSSGFSGIRLAREIEAQLKERNT